MLVGIMADSHDNLPKVEQAVNFFNQQNAELVLHAGDFIAPFVVNKLKNLHCPFVGVFGNNDGEKKGLQDRITSVNGEIHIPPYALAIADKRVLLLHDPQKLPSIDVSSYQLVIYGHTHHDEVIKEKGRIILNPGECGGWLSGKCTVALVDLDLMQVGIHLLD